MSILKLLFALNPKNLKLVKAAEMTPKMAQEIDSFLGKMGAVVNIGKYELTPSQAKYWRAQRKELTKYENKLNEMRSKNKLKKKEGIETLPEADVIDFPVKPKPPEGEPFADGGRVGMAAGGIAVLKSLLNFLAKGRGKKGSQLLQEVNPKKYGTTLENLMLPDDKKMVKGFRVEYLESLLDTIKTDKAMLDKMKSMPIDQREAFFDMINQGMNRGRLDVYKKIDPDEAILEIEQMIKNLKFKDVPEQEIKRQLNADGGRVGMMAGGITKIKKLLDLAKKTKSKLGEASKTDLKKVRAKAAADKKSTEELAKSEQIPVRDDTVKVKGEVMEDGTPDYDYYRELLDNDEYDVVKGNETLEQLEALLKEQDDYKKYMYGQYKAGKLGSNIGDDVKNISDTEIAKAYKQAREGNDLDLNDDKYDAQIIADYLSNNLYKTDFYDLPQDAQLDIYDKSLTWLMDDKMEKAMRAAKPMKGPIDMTTGKNIITGEKVIDVDYIPGESPLPKKRTLNANGGLATLFEERG